FTRSAGTYTMTVTDANGCTATTTASLTQPNTVTVSATPANPNPCTASNGKITLLAGGGAVYYNYSKDGGSTWGTSTLFTGLSAGTYTMQVRDTRLCTSVKLVVRVGCLVRMEDTASVVQTDYSPYFTVFPNPAEDHVLVSFSATADENCTINVSDLRGRMVATKTITAVEGDNNVPMDLQDIAKGVYMLTVKKNGDGILVKKIVLQ
ncbi:MAG: T9SS type A sorting domain-containing protein, partial [Bacteroidota bacterium]